MPRTILLWARTQSRGLLLSFLVATGFALGAPHAADAATGTAAKITLAAADTPSDLSTLDRSSWG